ncbi:hypothetical protein [Cytobacillus sp. NCCP-133]|uniref:hypothetical protein n=1 Tax=Cytobacillus sp. NCCP-133 TaxID=766848 RepID=UPI00222EA32F|nr:hypothetical protein [Cytobacillus sp. NCCP-133]GLB57897.1 hypothetical protein NCCP133_00300 [Cytobacillus sp. NCCP-133]
MFDPTAFENMKVVMEGGFYDRDLSGEIRIIDRNDILNSAKMARCYEITFTDIAGEKDISCSYKMEAGLENLAAELMPEGKSERLAGCRVSVRFTMQLNNDPQLFRENRKILRDIWGRERTIKQTVNYNPEGADHSVTAETFVLFNRLVYEEQIDDLSEMINYMIASLQALKNISL